MKRIIIYWLLFIVCSITGSSFAQNVNDMMMGSHNPVSIHLFTHDSIRLTIAPRGERLGVGTLNPRATLHLHNQHQHNIGVNTSSSSLNPKPDHPFVFSRNIFQITNATSGAGSKDGFQLELKDTSVYFRLQEYGKIGYSIKGRELASMYPEGSFCLGTLKRPAQLNISAMKRNGIFLELSQSDGPVAIHAEAHNYNSVVLQSRIDSIDQYMLFADGCSSIGSSQKKAGIYLNKYYNGYAMLIDGYNPDGKPGRGLVCRVPAESYKALVVQRIQAGNQTPVDNFVVKGDGHVYAREITVKLGTFPDYVFDPSYSLLPIDSLAVYVRQNEHLPGIPPAESVEANGVGIGELQLMLIEKLEEMALYIIELSEKQALINERLRKLEQ